MIKEFKEFISRGNVIDLAVGVIMGGAFSNIVTSLVNNVLMPFIGVLLGGLDFSNLSIQVDDATIKYGMFIQSIIDFLIVAVFIFIMIKFINKLASINHKKEEKKEEIKKEENTLLLEEIRDLLKTQSKVKKTTKTSKKTKS